MNLAPEVALLNRSIVIQGAEDDSGAISVQHFGARVYVSSFLNTDAYSDDFGAWPGTAVITNVELVRVFLNDQTRSAQ